MGWLGQGNKHFCAEFNFENAEVPLHDSMIDSCDSISLLSYFVIVFDHLLILLGSALPIWAVKTLKPIMAHHFVLVPTRQNQNK